MQHITQNKVIVLVPLIICSSSSAYHCSLSIETQSHTFSTAVFDLFTFLKIHIYIHASALQLPLSSYKLDFNALS